MNQKISHNLYVKVIILFISFQICSLYALAPYKSDVFKLLSYNSDTVKEGITFIQNYLNLNLNDLKKDPLISVRLLKKLNGFKVFRVSIDETYKFKNLGIKLIKNEFDSQISSVGDYEFTDFDLIFDKNDKLVAAFGVENSSFGDFDVFNLGYHFFEFYYYNFIPPQPGERFAKQRWNSFRKYLKRCQSVIKKYREQSVLNFIMSEDIQLSKKTNIPYQYFRVLKDFRIPESDVYGKREKNIYFKDARMHAAVLTKKALQVDAISSYSQDSAPYLQKIDLQKSDPRFFELVTWAFPTVYMQDKINWIADQSYYNTVINDIKEGDNILIVGPGIGVEVWIAALKSKKTVYVIGKNPLEVINTIATASLYGLKVKALIADNIVSEKGTPHFEGIQFDKVYWNMPFTTQGKSSSKKSYTVIWDRVDDLVLKRFISGLFKVLKKGGNSIIWNDNPHERGHSKFVMNTLLKNGCYRDSFDAPLNIKKLRVFNTDHKIFIIYKDFVDNKSIVSSV